MFKSALLIGIRNLLKNKLHSAINLSGFAIGITCSLLILAFVWDELHYDRFHPNDDRLYRLALHRSFPGRDVSFATTPFPAGPTLLQDIPEIESYCRLFTPSSSPPRVRIGDIEFYETNRLAADSTFFRLFGVQLKEGDPRNALKDPNSVVLTESTSKKYFGDQEALGKMIKVGDSTLYRVTGVAGDVPNRTHLEFDLLFSLRSFPGAHDGTFWGSYQCLNYFLLKPGVTPEQVKAKIPSVVKQYMGPQVESLLNITFDEYEAAGNRHNYVFQPIQSIHLESNFQNEIKPNGDKNYVYLFMVVSVLILCTACFNFVNLSTANSVKRGKEVAVRKVVGSSKLQLIIQFITESIVITLIAVLISCLLFIWLLPYFNQLAEKHIALSDFSLLNVAGLLLVFTALLGTLSGLYPAFFISSFPTLKIFKGELKLSHKKWGFRNILVVAQFMVSIFLMAATLFIYRQMNFMMDKKLGFDKDQVLVIERSNQLGGSLRAFMDELQQVNGVEKASASFHVPGRQMSGGSFHAQGVSATERYLFTAIYADYDFADTYGIKVNEGRFFSKDMASDTAAVLVNQATVDMVGWDNPLEQKILPTAGTLQRIIGVVDDFHFASLHEKVGPLVVFGISPQQLATLSPNLVSVRIGSGASTKATVQSIEATWSKWMQGSPIQYSFLDQEFNALYQNEERISRVFSTFSILAVCIALIGVVGLSTYIANQRTREIGIRKVLGSSASGILVLLSKDFVQLLIAANLLALPLAWLALSKWLEQYPYQTSLTIWLFPVIGIVFSFFIVLTTCLVTYKKAQMNPSKAIRYE
ncbi:ABC transporter permease [uncultured Imperialibacter sp.]|uniref:ABC transporter permease n=1 Tax=uncultured Imperialibacter sp. TaxID=1672639 RepID=UPI0030D86AA3|tara:strand:+ start:8717 stop:11149 length:2433 start_codon:yes stop_codon:yes gene_type:complete